MTKAGLLVAWLEENQLDPGWEIKWNGCFIDVWVGYKIAFYFDLLSDNRFYAGDVNGRDQVFDLIDPECFEKLRKFLSE